MYAWIYMGAGLDIVRKQTMLPLMCTAYERKEGSKFAKELCPFDMFAEVFIWCARHTYTHTSHVTYWKVLKFNPTSKRKPTPPGVLVRFLRTICRTSCNDIMYNNVMFITHTLRPDMHKCTNTCNACMHVTHWHTSSDSWVTLMILLERLHMLHQSLTVPMPPPPPLLSPLPSQFQMDAPLHHIHLMISLRVNGFATAPAAAYSIEN